MKKAIVIFSLFVLLCTLISLASCQIQEMQPTESEYLVYELLDDGTYGVSGTEGEPISVVIPEVHMEKSVTQILPDAFQEATNLTSVTIPNSVTVIGDRAFRGCSKLTELALPSSVEHIGMNAFEGCRELYTVRFSTGMATIGKDAFSDCPKLRNVHVPDLVSWCKIDFANWYANPTIWYGYLYINDELLDKFVLPEGLTAIGKNAFVAVGLDGVYVSDLAAWCAIDFGNEDSNPLQSRHGDLYLSGEKVTELVIPDSVTQIKKYAFANCSMQSVSIHSGVTTIGSSAFQDCSNLKRVYISDIAAWCEMDFSNVHSCPLIYGAELYLNGEPVKDIVIPDGVTRIPDFAFNHCTSLTSVVIPDSVTEIGKGAFYECTGLTEITIPGSVKDIGELAFCDCSGLKKVILQDGVSRIRQAAFVRCTSLNTIVIPESVYKIISSALAFESNSTTVYFGGNETAWEIMSGAAWGQPDEQPQFVTVLYYSETETPGCWHYVDGVPTPW